MELRKDAFFSTITANVDEEAVSRAWKHVDLMFREHVNNLRTKPLRETWRDMTKSTSPGLPYNRQGFKTKGDAETLILKDTRNLWREFKFERTPDVLPCLPGSRKVVRTVGISKPRLVWVYPAEMTLLEGQFAQPVIEALKNASWMGWNINWMECGRWMQRMDWTQYSGARASASHDFEQFDSRVLARWIKTAFSIISSGFTLSSTEQRALTFIERYFINTPLVWYRNGVVQKHRGIPSGSYFTQLVGTMVNMFYCFYAQECNRSYPRIVKEASIWLGDDSRLVLDDGWPKSEYLQAANNSFSQLGAVISLKKSSYVTLTTVGNDEKMVSTFLSRTVYARSPTLRFDRDKFIGSLVIPEDQDKSAEETLARIIGLAWSYGYDRSCYSILETAFTHAKALAKGKPKFSERLIRSLEMQLPGISEFLGSSLPSFDEVFFRYFGYV